MSVLPVTAQPKAKKEEPKFVSFARASMLKIFNFIIIRDNLCKEIEVFFTKEP